MMKCSLLFLCVGILTAQPLSFGIKGGGRITSDLDSYFSTSESRRYTVGPMATVGLPFGFRLEVDALYRRVGYLVANSDILGGSSNLRERGNSWEFPIILRKTLWRGIYGGVGYAPRVINGSGHANGFTVESLIPPTKTYWEYDVPGFWDTTHGVIGAAGIERRLGLLRIAPEVRFVYWNKPAVEQYGSRGSSIVSTQHQVDLLVGISFP